MPDPNANVLTDSDVDLDGADGSEVPLVRPAALGPALLALDDGPTYAGEVVRRADGLWFIVDGEATWQR